MIKFKCGKCGLQLKDSITFAEHRELHEHLPENHCPICKRDMKSNKNLRSHVKSCNVSHLNLFSIRILSILLSILSIFFEILE